MKFLFKFTIKIGEITGKKIGESLVKLFHCSPVNHWCGEFLQFPTLTSVEVIYGGPLSFPHPPSCSPLPPSPVSYYHHVAINSVVYTDSERGTRCTSGVEITRAMSLLTARTAFSGRKGISKCHLSVPLTLFFVPMR